MRQTSYLFWFLLSGMGSIVYYRLGTNFGQGPINGHVLKFCINCECTDKLTIDIVPVFNTLGTYHTVQAVSAVSAYSNTVKFS